MWEGQHHINTYDYTHVRYEGYREATLSGTSTKLDPGKTTYNYDANGHLVGVTDTHKAANNQQLINDVHGKILRRSQNGQVTRTLVVNGEMLGSMGPQPGADDFSPSYRRIDGSNPAPSPGSYRIQAGDTLQSIAQQAYGDSRLWYLVAEANGLMSDRDLRVGASVTVPNRVSGNHNDYQTFRPYDPGKLIGDTQPTMPVPEADGGRGGGCGGVGKIFVAVVAVVATVFTAGAALAAIAPAAAATFAGTAAAGVGVLTGAASVSLATSVGIGVMAGAVGGMVSQGAGIAVGAQRKFNWKGVAAGAVGAGATAGVGSALSSVGLVPAASVSSGASATASPWAIAARAAVSSSVSQGVSVATGLQTRFSWAGVAASAVGAGVASYTAGEVFLSGSRFANGMAAAFAGGMAGSVTASVLGGGKINTLQVAVDAFGNALGNAVAEAAGELGGEVRARTVGLGADAYPSAGALSDREIQALLRNDALAAIERSDGGYGIDRGANDLSFLRAVGQQSDGGMGYNTGAVAYDVAPAQSLAMWELPPIAASGGTNLSETPTNAGLVLSDLNRLEEYLISGLDKRISDPTIGGEAEFFNRAARVAVNMGVGILEGGATVAGYATESAFRSQVNSGIVNSAQALYDNPMAVVDGVSSDFEKWRAKSWKDQVEGAVQVLAGAIGGGGLLGAAKKGLGVANDVAALGRRIELPIVDIEKKQLLRNEGQIGRYRDLRNAGTKGDNLTPHHIPSDNHMSRQGVSRGDGIAINMEQPHPGVGGRHRATFTYGTTADVDMRSRDALAAGVWDARRIYQKDGLYDSYIRQQLRSLILQNKTAHPSVFGKN